MPENTPDPTAFYKVMTLLLLLPSFSLSYILLMRYSKMKLGKIMSIDATWPPALLFFEIILITKLEFVPLLLVTAVLLTTYMAFYAIRYNFLKTNSN